MADPRFGNRIPPDAGGRSRSKDRLRIGAIWAGAVAALALIAHTLLTYPV